MPEEVVDGRVPAGVAAGQVVVDGDQVGALAQQRVEVEGEGGHQGLALTGLHLGDLAVVEHDAPHQLDVEVAHPEDPARRLADHREGLREDLVEPLRLLRLALLLLPAGELALDLRLALGAHVAARELGGGPVRGLAEHVQVLGVGLAEADVGPLVADPLAELVGLVAKLLVGEGAHLLLEAVDLLDDPHVAVDLPLVGIAEHLAEQGHETS